MLTEWLEAVRVIRIEGDNRCKLFIGGNQVRYFTSK